MYVIEINGHEVFLDIGFEPGDHTQIKKVEVITGFSQDNGYIKEIAPEWLRDMIVDPNLLYWDIVVQDETTSTIEPDTETWACLPFDPT